MGRPRGAVLCATLLCLICLLASNALARTDWDLADRVAREDPYEPDKPEEPDRPDKPEEPDRPDRPVPEKPDEWDRKLECFLNCMEAPPHNDDWIGKEGGQNIIHCGLGCLVTEFNGHYNEPNYSRCYGEKPDKPSSSGGSSSSKRSSSTCPDPMRDFGP
jgi:hypothetical protein